MNTWPDVSAGNNIRTFLGSGFAIERHHWRTGIPRLGHWPGFWTDMINADALRRGQIGAEDFPNQLMELLWFLDGNFPEGHPFKDNVEVNLE